jgi:hypothetical protein
MPLFTSDELPHYETVLRERYSHPEEHPKTGKRGRPRSPKVVVDPDLKYATVHKTRKNGKIVKVEQKVIFGNPSEIDRILENSPVSQTINTSFLERCNLTLRNHNRKLSRKTICFAKAKKSLNAQMNITVTYCNFTKPHGSLTIKSADGRRIPRTPAMAAQICEAIWPIAEILAFPMANND